MKVQRAILSVCLVTLAGCITMGDFRKSQEQLKANSRQRKVYVSIKDAANEGRDKCVLPTANKWTLEITDKDSIIKQDEHGTLGYFKILCLEADGSPHRLQVTGVHAGGGFGKAFFLLPKITLVDGAGKSISGNFISIKQNPWSGNLEGSIDLGALKRGRYILIFEGDNRTGANGIGTYVQDAYGGGVFIKTNVEMYSLPTGKAEVSLQ